MKHEPLFAWDNGVASCILTDGNKIYTGVAQCHPHDEDMMSEKTGCEIALRRARINAFRGYRDELKTKLAALRQLYFSMDRSKKFNEKSYEVKMLKRQIKILQNDIDEMKNVIHDEQLDLKDYLEKKDDFYKLIRERREAKDN